jgi:putative transposase
MEQQTVPKAYKYKLKPTPEQARRLERVPLLCRHRYNAAIGEWSEAWRMRGVCVTSSQRQAALPGSKEAMPEYGEVHSQVLQDVVLRVDRAFQAFFRRIRAGQTPGSPRYHGRDRSNGLTYPQLGEHGGARLDNGFLVLSKIGRSGVRWSRPIAGTPKTVTISHEADGWSRTAERALKTAQRRVARRKRGSQRRRKAVTLLAKAHQKVKRQRQDFHHKTALALVRQYDALSHENLQPANRVKNHHLAKSIRDAGWGAFLTILTDKAACAGRRVVGVNPASTSQQCSGCGVLVYKGLSVRWHSCPVCGASLHRDHNAAQNRESAGQALRGGVA